MCEVGFQEFPIPPLSKHGVISGNMQEIDEEKENSNIKRIAKFLCLGLSSFLSTFLIVQNSYLELSHDCDHYRHRRHIGTLWSMEWRKRSALMCTRLKAAFHSCEPSEGSVKVLSHFQMPEKRSNGWENRRKCFQHDQRAVWSLREEKWLACCECLEGSDKCKYRKPPS